MYISDVCISTSIFCFQLWLIFMGKVPKPWETSGTITITDSLSNNSFTLPTFGALSIIFSALNIVKAMIELNISQVHVDKIGNSKAFFKKFVGCCLCQNSDVSSHIRNKLQPCLASTTIWFSLFPLLTFCAAHIFFRTT